MLDLTDRRLEDGICDNGQHTKWEARFNGVMGIRAITDPGISMPLEATSVALTTTGGLGPIYALPANQCSMVVIARPILDSVCISQSRRYVYTRFNVEILHELKRAKHTARQGEQVVAVQFGGSILFPSGHLATFLLDKDGFVGLGKQYVLFLWKPVQSDDTYVAVEAYLIQDGFVFPVDTSASNAFHYTKMPLKDFESKVRAAVAKIDTD